MAQIVVVTGAGAGVGRETAQQFALKGCDIGLIARNRERLETAAGELRALGVRVCVAPADMADAEAVDQAANAIEAELGPIDIWVNNAMATIFAPVADITPAEFKRATEATYLGTVHGVMTALRKMKARDQGTIINVGSALAYRSVPLQSPYCGAKAAIKGFTDSLRSELIHDHSNIKISMVHLPAVNTPQFDWAMNKLGHRAQPVPPIYSPEVPAKAIVFCAFNYRREIWVGMPTVVAILANRIAPGFADKYLATHGYTAQMTKQVLPPDAPANLFESVPGNYGARGRFSNRSRKGSFEMFTDRHKAAAYTLAASVGMVALVGLHRLAKKYDF